MKKASRRVRRITLLVLVAVALSAGQTFLPNARQKLLRATVAFASDILGFTEQVSPDSQKNSTEPYIAVDRSDGTIYVAWQASGSKVARSDDGGRTFVQTPIPDPFGRDLGDVAIRVGGPTPCGTATPTFIPVARRVY